MTHLNSGKIKIYFFVITTILAASFFHICLSDLHNLDEIWNYSLSRAITMGLLPYKDYNMVQTPLYFMIMSIPLFALRSLYVYRIACTILAAFVSFAFYRVVSEQSHNDLLPLPFALISIIAIDYVSYNDLFFLILLGVLILLKKRKTDLHTMIIGALCALAVFSRQTSGCILLIMMLIIIIAFFNNKVKNLLLYIAGAGIPCFAFLAYFLCTSSFSDFWDYCLFGLSSFGNNNASIMNNAFWMLVTIVLELITDVIIFMKKKDKNVLIHILLGLSVISIFIPIVDYCHTRFAVVYFAIPILTIFSEKFSIKIRKQTVILLSAALVSLYLLFGISKITGTGRSDRTELRNLPIRPGSLDNYELIADIAYKWKKEGYTVTVLSGSAVVISIMNEECNPPFDLFLNGNFSGRIDSPLVYVEEACNGPDKIVIIETDYPTNGWQNPSGVLEYVQANCQQTDTCGLFSIYKGH